MTTRPSHERKIELKVRFLGKESNVSNAQVLEDTMDVHPSSRWIFKRSRAVESRVPSVVLARLVRVASALSTFFVLSCYHCSLFTSCALHHEEGAITSFVAERQLKQPHPLKNVPSRFDANPYLCSYLDLI
jgi:hypothetical protein